MNFQSKICFLLVIQQKRIFLFCPTTNIRQNIIAGIVIGNL
jgi:hypothetical protein